MKINKLITPIIGISTLSSTFVIPMTTTSCSSGNYSEMKVEDLQKSKEITGDSDKETINYKFVQTEGEHFEDTYAVITELKVHNQEEQALEGLLYTTHRSDRTIDVDFNTQFFISHYLSKYYSSDSNYEAVPSTFKFKLVNDKDKQEFTSAEYKITINPAQYAIACTSYSDKLQLPADSTSYVLREYSEKYTIADGYQITNRSIKRYDGAELYGKDGVVFDNGIITIPASYITGPITISASADAIRCDVFTFATTESVTINDDFPQYVGYKEKDVEGTYTLASGKELDETLTGVYVDGQWLTDGYSIKDGKVKVNKDKVTGYVAVCIGAKGETPVVKYKVSAQGDEGLNKVIYSPSEIIKGSEVDITGEYTINDGYEFDANKTYVLVNGKKLDHGYSIKDGKILVNKSVITGNVVIFIGTTKIQKTVKVYAAGDYYVNFGKDIPSAVVGQDYKITYHQTYGSINPNKVKVSAGNEQLQYNKDFTVGGGIITISKNCIIENNDITITASGTPTDFGFTSDFDDRIYVVSHTTPNYMVDFKCVIGLYMEAGTVTGWGCAVGGDETYSQYLQYDSETKTFTLPGQYVKGNIKIWASLA